MRVAIPALAFIVMMLSGCATDDRLIPDVRRATAAEMKVLACGADGAGACPEVMVVHDHETGTIYLRASWDMSPAGLDDYRQSTLIHELVHHVQALRGEFKTRCWGDLEREAYQAQMAFLKARGHDNPLETIGLGPLNYAIITTCE